jgi:hypothetical protein
MNSDADEMHLGLHKSEDGLRTSMCVTLVKNVTIMGQPLVLSAHYVFPEGQEIEIVGDIMKCLDELVNRRNKTLAKGGEVIDLLDKIRRRCEG